MNSDTMTKSEVEELECPKCGHRHQLKKYSLINDGKTGHEGEDSEESYFLF